VFVTKLEVWVSINFFARSDDRVLFFVRLTVVVKGQSVSVDRTGLDPSVKGQTSDRDASIGQQTSAHCLDKPIVGFKPKQS